MGSNIDVASTGQLVNRLLNPPNPMEQLGQTTNALTAVRNFQAQQAAAQAYTQAVDPTTGQLDMGKFNALLAQNPTSAWNLGAQMQQSGQGVEAQGRGTTANVKANLDQLDAIGRLTEPLYQQAIVKHEVNPADAQAAVDQAYQMKLITPQQYQAYTATLKNGDSKAAANWVIGANTGNAAARELAIGHPGMADAGGVIQPYQPVPGALPPANAPIQKTFTPGETIGTVDVPIPGGQSAKVPQWVASQGGEAIRQWLEATKPPGYTPGSYDPNSYQPPAAGGGGGGGGGGGQPPVQPGRYPRPAAPQPPPATSGPEYAKPPPPSAAGGGYGVTPQPGFADVSGASTAAHNALQAEITQSQQIKPTLSDMESNIRQGATTGVGAEQLSGLRQLAINLGLTPDRSAGDPNQASTLAAQEELKKNAALLQGYQLQSLGKNPTDARQELSEASRPGGTISPQGNLNLIHMLQGNQQAIEVVGKAWDQAQQNGWPVNRFNEWVNNHFYTATDPATGGKFNRRVFWMANAPDLKAQQEIYNAVPKNQQEQFKKDLRYAGSQGWVTQDPNGDYRPGSP